MAHKHTKTRFQLMFPLPQSCPHIGEWTYHMGQNFLSGSIPEHLRAYQKE